MTQRFPRLDSCRDLELDLLAIDARDGDGAAQCSGGKADRCFGDQGRPITFEDRMPFQMDEQVKIAGSGVADARFALAGDADTSPFVDASRDIDVQPARLE